MRRPALLAPATALALLAPLALPLLLAGPGAAEPPAHVLVRVAEVVAPDEPSTAVVAGPAGSDLVGTAFEVLRANGNVAARGTLVAVPDTAAGEPVDPAPFGEVALAELPALERPGTYTLAAAGGSASLTVQAAPYASFMATLFDLFDHNADGKESRSHGPSHLHDKAARIANGPLRGTVANLVGGYMDAGDQVKFTLTIAHAAVLLEIALYETGDQALRDELTRYADIAVRYLRRTHPADGPFVSLVGHVETDHDAGFRDPALDDASDDPRLARRPAYAFTRRTGGSDAAGLTAAALALAAGRSTGRPAAALVAAAREWLALARKLKGPWDNVYYPTETWLDDVATAQVALASVTGDAALAVEGAATLEQALAPGGEVRGWQVQVDGYDMGAIPAAMLCGVLAASAQTLVPAETSQRGCDLLAAGVRDAEYKASFDPFGLPAPYVWGTSRQVGSSVAVALLADEAGDRDAITTARRGFGWFLGSNPWGRRFQAGYGVAHPYHWQQVLRQDTAPVGAVVGGPAPVEEITRNTVAPAYEPGPFDTSTIGYRDHPLDYVSNEVSLGYQAPWVLAAALALR